MARGKKSGGGSRKGKPNRATADARSAIARFVDGNAHRLQGWLDRIAEGTPKLDEGGDPKPGEYVTAPNPLRAFEAFQSVIEYHVPKLGRTEHVGDGGAPIQVNIVDPTRNRPA